MKSENTVAKTLRKLHLGEPIEDRHLNLTICRMKEIYDCIPVVSSCPEYAVFLKQWRKDYETLKDFQHSRKKWKKNMSHVKDAQRGDA
jgi:hypothetical protein